MRLFTALAAAALVLAGCSSEAGTPTPAKNSSEAGTPAPAKVGCDGFDKRAVAKALGTTEPVTEGSTDKGAICQIIIGAPPTSRTGVFVNIHPDSEKFGYAKWRQTAAGARDLSLSNGDKAFVAPATRPNEAQGGVLHDRTFYRFSAVSLDDDPTKVITAVINVLEGAL